MRELSRTPEQPWPFGAHSRMVRSAGIDWHVQLLGAGPPLLLLHGMGASSHSFAELMPLLAEHFTVLAPDLPGLGLSEAARGFRPSLPGIARALRGLLTDLQLAPRVVVGHSAGAALALRLTLDRAVTPGLVVGVAAALHPLSPLARAVLTRAAGALERASSLVAWSMSDTERVELILRNTGAVLDAQGVEFYRLLSTRPQHVSGTLSMMAHWDLAPLYRELPSLSVPLCLLAGELDRAVPLAQLRAVARHTPAAQLRVLGGLGHLLHEERPLSIARAILDEAVRLGA
jgi:magnesium chelatase accessory protein